MPQITPVDFSQLHADNRRDTWYFFITFKNEQGETKRAICLTTYEWLTTSPEAREYNSDPEKWREGMMEKITAGEHGFTFDTPIFVQATTAEGKAILIDMIREKLLVS